MSTFSLPGAGLGLLLAAGLTLIWIGLPARRRPDLRARVEPYVRTTPRPSRLLATTPGQGWGDLATPLLSRLGSVLDHTLGLRTSVTHRLQRAGLPPDVDGFRIQQALWGIAAGVAALGLASLLWWRRGTDVLPLVLLVLVASALGVVLRDQVLSRAARARDQRILQQLPAIAEMLALSVTAGEGPVAALNRIVRLSRGDLAAELELCLADTRAGSGLPAALAGLGERTGLPAVTRFADGMVVALQRGTPLADVLHAQAQDAREAGRQALIEEGGKREIAMMIPVVFLVLPVTILFAVFPGVSLLRISL